MNRLKKVFLIGSVAALFGCAEQKTAEVSSFIPPQMSKEEVGKRVFTPEVMLKMGRLSSPMVSNDGKKVLYNLTYMNVEENSSRTNLFVMDGTAWKEAVALTTGDFKDVSPQWSSDSKSVYFLSNREGGAMQLWSINIANRAMKQLTFIDGGINGYQISPNGESIWYSTQVKVDETAKDIYPSLPKSKAMIYDDLMVRHWNYWLDGTYSHLFVADFKGDKIANSVDIMAGEPWDAPLAPYFDFSEITWDNSGAQIAYTCKKLKGREYAESTNSDIYLYDMSTKQTKNLTEGMPGYDRNPIFSPDNSKMAWVSMERAGNESDKARLFVYDMKSGKKSYVTRDFDSDASSITWSGSDDIYFITPLEATRQICMTKATEGAKVEVLTAGDHDYTSISILGDKLLAERTTLSAAAEMFEVDPLTGKATQISYINKNIYDNVDMGRVEKRWVKTTDGKKMLTWVILPPNFDENKKYPTLLYCQGGPQSTVSQSWSYRWNFQLMAAQGYVVVAPNRRGLQSFGQEWLDQISGDYSGQNIDDYLSAIDDVATEKWVDKDRLGCVGASYGGYSTYYLAGHHQKRFKAFISHCGMFNFESFYYSTEELWFPNNDLGGSPLSTDPTAERSYKYSPHKFVKDWDSPILIFVGLKDYRIPYTESLQAFTAARLKGLEARIVAFEDEGHQVFKAQNSLVWNHEFFNWLDKYLKK